MNNNINNRTSPGLRAKFGSIVEFGGNGCHYCERCER